MNVATIPWYKRAIHFLGLRRSMAAMLSMVILVGMGEHMAERFLPIYLLAFGVLGTLFFAIFGQDVSVQRKENLV